jgi:hypothetical protein
MVTGPPEATPHINVDRGCHKPRYPRSAGPRFWFEVNQAAGSCWGTLSTVPWRNRSGMDTFSAQWFLWNGFTLCQRTSFFLRSKIFFPAVFCRICNQVINDKQIILDKIQNNPTIKMYRACGWDVMSQRYDLPCWSGYTENQKNPAVLTTNHTLCSLNINPEPCTFCCTWWCCFYLLRDNLVVMRVHLDLLKNLIFPSPCSYHL